MVRLNKGTGLGKAASKGKQPKDRYVRVWAPRRSPRGGTQRAPEDQTDGRGFERMKAVCVCFVTNSFETKSECNVLAEEGMVPLDSKDI